MAVDCDLDGSEFIEMSRVNWDQSTSRPVRATCAAAGVSWLFCQVCCDRNQAAKRIARWWHRAGSEEGDGGGL